MTIHYFFTLNLNILDLDFHIVKLFLKYLIEDLYFNYS